MNFCYSIYDCLLFIYCLLFIIVIYYNLLLLFNLLFNSLYLVVLASLVAQTVKNPLAMGETWVQPLAWEDPLEKEMATHSSILAWKIPWTEDSGRLQSMGLQRVRHSGVTFTFTHSRWMCGTSSKEPTCQYRRHKKSKEPMGQCRRYKKLELDPWVRNIPWKREW